MTLSAVQLASRSPIIAALVVLLGALSGCGSDGVTAKGVVTVDGEPANGGELLLSSPDGQHKLFSFVNESGEFALQQKGKFQVPAGQYGLSYRRPLDPNLRQKLPARLQQSLGSDEMTVTYSAPATETLLVPEGGGNELRVAVNTKQWQPRLSD